MQRSSEVAEQVKRLLETSTPKRRRDTWKRATYVALSIVFLMAIGMIAVWQYSTRPVGVMFDVYGNVVPVEVKETAPFLPAREAPSYQILKPTPAQPEFYKQYSDPNDKTYQFKKSF